MNKTVKAIIQILFFLWIPESFSASLYALKTLAHALCAHQSAGISGAVIILLGTLIPTILFGRYYCGYICAFGAMQDLSFFVGSRIRKDGKEYVVPSQADRILSKLKYVILAVILVCAALDIRIPGSISPWTSFGILTSVFKGGFDGSAVWSPGLILLLIIIVLTALFFRAFCRYLCPLGALYTLVSAFSWDKRHKKCRNNGGCCICHHNCKQYKINYIGLAVTILLFIASHVYFMTALKNPVQYTVENHEVVEMGSDQESVETSSVQEVAEADSELEAVEAVADQEAVERGPYQDGVAEGIGEGYRGDIHAKVTVEDGYIVSIEVTDYKDDDTYMSSVLPRLIPAVLEAQSTDVDVISGATYSSKGILDAIEQAINPGGEVVAPAAAEQSTNPEDDTDAPAEEQEKPPVDLSHLEDGTYEGTAIGFRGEIAVSVTVKDHAIEKIRILSYYDNEEYLFHIAPAVIEEITENKPLDIDAVSGATYSSNGLTRAIEDALQLDENTFEILEPRPRADKDKQQHHVVQKFVESDEEYEEMVEKYRELLYGPDGKVKK